MTTRKTIKDAYQRLSDRYRSLQRKQGLRGQAEAQAYVVARMPATKAAIDKVLQEIPDDASIQSILDIGAGPGTATLAALERWSAIETVTLLENDPHMRELQHQFLLSIPCTILEIDARKAELPIHDLVICAYMMNELPLDDQISLISKAWAATQKYLVIVVPGTPEHYADLMAIRSHSIQMGAQILAPCPHLNACSLEGRPGEWCRFPVRLARSREHKAIKGGGLGYEDESFSYMIFSRVPVEEKRSRLIQEPKRHRGHINGVLCTPDGYAAVSATQSKSLELYRDLKKKAWGQTLV